MRIFAASCITAALAIMPVMATAQPPAGHGEGMAPIMLGTNDNATIPAAPKAPEGPHVGKVLRTINSGGYTYVELKKKGGEKIWLAVTAAEIPVGSQQTFNPGMAMTNFESKTLKRSFDKIYFTELVPSGKAGKDKKEVVGKSPGSKGTVSPDVKVKVKKASGKNAYTISELYKNSAKLNKKKVVVRGKVVKVSSNIMGKNWVHLRDGSGSHASGDFNLVVTSSSIPAEGEVVLVNGT
ncbi:MAG TPA: DNA-binding protein, partial [Geobacteraceae bacterium]|nr:DNA-binding protein [Geobacteraceae bacterium]